ncbi:unnamed protein product [Amoebophrya sp. A120]|nr:unnamed protein product [Amoebophrya sp. A120]|eukprot:GSA120T00022310001.1
MRMPDKMAFIILDRNQQKSRTSNSRSSCRLSTRATRKHHLLAGKENIMKPKRQLRATKVFFRVLLSALTLFPILLAGFFYNNVQTQSYVFLVSASLPASPRSVGSSNAGYPGGGIAAPQHMPFAEQEQELARQRQVFLLQQQQEQQQAHRMNSIQHQQQQQLREQDLREHEQRQALLHAQQLQLAAQEQQHQHLHDRSLQYQVGIDPPLSHYGLHQGVHDQSFPEPMEQDDNQHLVEQQYSHRREATFLGFGVPHPPGGSPLPPPGGPPIHLCMEMIGRSELKLLLQMFPFSQKCCSYPSCSCIDKNTTFRSLQTCSYLCTIWRKRTAFLREREPLAQKLSFCFVPATNFRSLQTCSYLCTAWRIRAAVFESGNIWRRSSDSASCQNINARALQ